MTTRGWIGAAAAAAWMATHPAAAFKVYIFADMEGCSGITASEQIGGARADEGKRLMEGDINACVEGCFAAGATEVIVRDGHSAGKNVDPARIDPGARLIQGPTPGARFKDIDGSAAIILLGYHAMALTPSGVLAHTYSSAKIQRMRLNGREVGEIGVDAAIAAEHGVPVALVVGDDKTVAEAKAWAPGALGVETKRGTGWQSAEVLPVEESRRRIREQTEAALRRHAEIKPVQVSYPVTIEWEYLPDGSLRTYHPKFRPVDSPRRVSKTGSSVEQLLVHKP